MAPCGLHLDAGRTCSHIDVKREMGAARAVHHALARRPPHGPGGHPLEQARCCCSPLALHSDVQICSLLIDRNVQHGSSLCLPSFRLRHRRCTGRFEAPGRRGLFTLPSKQEGDATEGSTDNGSEGIFDSPDLLPVVVPPVPGLDPAAGNGSAAGAASTPDPSSTARPGSPLESVPRAAGGITTTSAAPPGTGQYMDDSDDEKRWHEVVDRALMDSLQTPRAQHPSWWGERYQSLQVGLRPGCEGLAQWQTRSCAGSMDPHACGWHAPAWAG